jgi:hypothetical protein
MIRASSQPVLPMVASKNLYIHPHTTHKFTGRSSHVDNVNLNNATTGAIVATFIAGEAIGAIAQSLSGDQPGRKHFMRMMCVIRTGIFIRQTRGE